MTLGMPFLEDAKFHMLSPTGRTVVEIETIAATFYIDNNFCKLTNDEETVKDISNQGYKRLSHSLRLSVPIPYYNPKSAHRYDDN